MTGPRGNALFLILIAVALFAALSYAVTQSGRGGRDASREQVSIAAAQLIQQVTALRTAAQRMVLTGTTPSTFLFCSSGDTDGFCLPPHADPNLDGCETGEDCVYAAEGGGANIVQIPEALWATSTEALFLNVETQAGMYITGVGTSAAEALLVTGVSGISEEACNEINKGLGLSHTPVASDADSSVNGYQAYPGEPFHCFLGAASAPTLVFAIIEQ